MDFSPHEQSDSDGRREHLEGIGVQLIEETTEQDLSEAEEEIASALSLPELPTVKQQIRSIEERQAALYAGEISIPSDVVDEVLRKGGNKDRSHLRIIYNFMIEQTGTSFDEFSPEQMDVIYSSAENGMDITLLLNPEFSPAQIQLIADVMERISANERYRFESEIEKLTSVVMTPEEINKKECGGNRQWQNHYSRKWAADTKDRVTI